LLYYPLPFPYIAEKPEFLKEWKSKKKKNGQISILASCNVYYVSNAMGRFLIKLELNEKHELSLDIQTSRENYDFINNLELAVAEGMFLLQNPPLLSDLNVLLSEEIYKATDINEELSIVSDGPLRLEIILAVYSILTVLNKFSNDPAPSGLIDMIK